MEKSNIILLVITSALLGGMVGYVAGSHGDHHDDHSEHMERSGSHDHDMTGSRNKQHHQSNDSTQRTGDGHDMHNMIVENEKDFLLGMIPHHEEAVETAKEVLARGATTPEIKSLVEGIISSQEKEIAEMKAWYLTWYGDIYQDSGRYQPMMRELRELSGISLDKVFLEDMIIHHEGAITMTNSVEPYITQEEIRQLTTDIKTNQSNEIDIMKDILAGI